MFLLSKLLFLIIVIPNVAFANYVDNNQLSVKIITDNLENILLPIVSFLAFLFLGAEYQIAEKNLQINIFGFPLLVAWLLMGGVFFTFKLGFVNIRLFAHAINVVRGKYSEADAPGKVTPLQALFTAIAATVGLGNIAGVAIAISIGGPGAVLWMVIAAFLGMSTKLAEVILGQKYRQFKNGRLLAGAFYYLEDGLKEKNLPKLGKFLAKIAAICCIGGAIGAGLMFQANQAVLIITDSFAFSPLAKLLLVIIIATLIGVILIGGINRIAKIAEKIVPFMAIIYILSCLIILFVNYDQILNAINIIFISAFYENALYGGVIGAIIQGFKRSAFSNEAGLGSAPIAHAAAKTREPVREGAVALLEPFIDTIIICFMTGIVITVTGVYENKQLTGVLMTRDAFATVSIWFPYILSMVVFLFSFSTMLTYSYYGQQAWLYLTNNKNINICYITFIFFIFVGGMINIDIVIDFADILFLSMAVPNLLGMYIMSGNIKDDVNDYIFRLKNDEFKDLYNKNSKKINN